MGLFQKVGPDEGLPETQIHDLWRAPDGLLWVASDAGIHVYDGGHFSQLYDQPALTILGMDGAQRVWVLGEQGASIHAYDGTAWRVYRTEQGWTPLEYFDSVGGLVSDPQGVVWLATGSDDLRRFNPETGMWTLLTAVGIGYSPADENYDGHLLGDVELSPSGSLWAADCISMGEGFDGQGVRYYREGTWSAIPATAGHCVRDIERGPDDRMWVGGTDAILVYDPATGNWAKIPPPPWERRQYIIEITFDPAGRPWVGSLLCGGASCDTVAINILQDDRWLPVPELTGFYGPALNIVFDESGAAWAFREGKIYRYQDGETSLVGTVDTAIGDLEVDRDGTVWVADVGGYNPGLWRGNPGW